MYKLFILCAVSACLVTITLSSSVSTSKKENGKEFDGVSRATKPKR